MDRFIIDGPCQIKGSFEVSGAKNEALKLIPLAFCLKSPLKIFNVPDIADIRSQLKIAGDLGAMVEFAANTVSIDATGVERWQITSHAAKKLRASIVYLGPLLARFGQVRCPHPGGCVIGARSIDTHTQAFRDLGIKIEETCDEIYLSFEDVSKLAAEIRLREQSVSATENVLLFLSAIGKKTKVTNCAIEPEIMGLVEALNRAGAKITSSEERSFEVIGSSDLKLEEVKVMADRIEAGTYLIALVASGAQGEVRNFPAETLTGLVDILKDSGANIQVSGDVAKVTSSAELMPFSIETAPYPGFATDLQSPMALIAMRAKGTSTIIENMFENRLEYLKQMQKMGLEVNLISPKKAEITGPCQLKATKVHSLDLRSGITLLLAAALADGTSTLLEAQNIDRGYEKIEEKLQSVGIKIKRVKDD